jgi:hypothetical protein
MRTTLPAVLLLAALAAAGCRKPKNTAPAGNTGKPLAATHRPPPRRPGGIVSRNEVMQIFRQVGLAFQNYCGQNNKPVQSIDDLAPFFENDRKILAAFKDGSLTLCKGAHVQTMLNGTSNTIIAYETEPGTDDKRVVLLGDGTPKSMDEDEFKKTPKAGQK